MGIKDLWPILTPHAVHKPICELRGKTVAIDLAGWVCENLNVVDYFVHPKLHLKNLFFRTCYLIWEDITPVFVLEGTAPNLKSQTIAKRNEIQFRGVQPKQTQSNGSQKTATSQNTEDKGRTRFNHVLKECAGLLKAMGMQCVQGPGEAEAYCAFLNKEGLVDGVISQDSDCFAYGAVCVYRNFSISTQATQSGAIDIYDMNEIFKVTGIGRNKIIVMALLCGCDYCHGGVEGVGRDSVLKFFEKYNENDIMDRVRSWRAEDSKYTSLEMRVNDKTICGNCGHMGRTQNHAKNGCGICRTHRGCIETDWKEERLSLKAELLLRKKALADPTFPNEKVIEEFMREPTCAPQLSLHWQQPNIVEFIRKIGQKLQWTEIYCFQKFFPIVTRWQVRNSQKLKSMSAAPYVNPKEILKKRTVKGVPSLELVWEDNQGLLTGLIPNDQLKEYEMENVKGQRDLWTTVEPLTMLEQAYPEMVASFLKSNDKSQKVKNDRKTKKKANNKQQPTVMGSLGNLADLMGPIKELEQMVKPKQSAKTTKKYKGLQMIDKFLKKSTGNFTSDRTRRGQTAFTLQCSTPVTKFVASEPESDNDDFDMSDIINGIVKQAKSPLIKKHAGHKLIYDEVSEDFSFLHMAGQKCLDDLDVIAHKRNLSISDAIKEPPSAKRISLDDSFDVLVNKGNHRMKILLETAQQTPLKSFDLFKQQKNIKKPRKSHRLTFESSDGQSVANGSVSYFFDQCQPHEDVDAFEKFVESSFSGKSTGRVRQEDELILISDTSDDANM